MNTGWRVIAASLIQSQPVKNRCAQWAEHTQLCERPVLLHTAAWCRASNRYNLGAALTPVIMVWSWYFCLSDYLYANTFFFCGNADLWVGCGRTNNGVCANLNGRVPLPVLWELLVRLLRLWLERLILLLWHFHHGVLRFLQLGAFLGWALPSPTHLRTTQHKVLLHKPTWMMWVLLVSVGGRSNSRPFYCGVRVTSILLIPPIPLPP